jgi:hypothetical protein
MVERRRRMAQEKSVQKEQAPVRGRVTYADLGRTAPFFLPWEQDPWGRLRPPFSQELMRLSLELSSTAQNLRVGDWMRAGWTDFNFQVDNKLVGGVSPAPVSETRQFLYNKWAVYRARANLRQLNPVRQVFSAIRQREQSDTGKAVMMIKDARDGRYVVAMGFRSTGSRFYDWFSNLRFASENGINQGFLQLARQFDGNADRVAFPETARALGLENLTLANILAEARQHDSRFKLWLAGHSQGAAVMQILTYLWIQESGVLPENILGYGFASPTVMMGNALADPAAYPLYHVLNSDDYVPRAGAQMHLGVCLFYPAGEEVSRAAYGWRETSDAQNARAEVQRLTKPMVDMPSLIEYGMAYLQTLACMPMADMLSALNLIRFRILPIKQVMAVAGTSQQGLLKSVRRRVEKAYRTLTGHDLDQAVLNGLQAEFEAVMAKVGPGEFTRAIGEMLYWPHVLKNSPGKSHSAYQYIALRGVSSLHPAIWQSGSPPKRLWLEVPEEAPASSGLPEALPLGALYNRRRLPASRRPVRCRHRGYTSRRAAYRL